MPTQTAEQSQSQSTSAEATASTETLNLHDQTIQSGSLPAAQDRNDAHVPTQPSSDQDDSSVKGKQRADAPPPSVTKPPPSTGSESSPKTKQPNLQPADSNDSSTEQKTNVEDNEDYRAISKALDVLRHQLKQALKDVETLENLKRKAMDDPFEFLADLKAKRTRGKIPKLQKIACVPDIDWSKYRFLPENRYAEQSARFSAMAQGIQDHSRHIPAFRTALGYDEPSRMETGSPSPTVARLQQEIAKAHQAIGQISSVSATASDMSDRDSDDEGRASKVHSGVGKGKGVRRTSVTQTGDLPSYQPPPIPPSILESPPKPRDRPLLDTTKGPLTDQEIESATYNQPWTDEEQRRLEELLEIYPDEPVQSQRFQKIAKALGTRTARQVASRVQKYFIKLAKLGLPVPGRVSIPPSRSSTPKKASRKPKARGGSSARGPRPSMRTSGVGYNAMVSGGITNTRISGAHYLTMQGPPSALMSDDEDDNVKETMLKVVQPQAEGEAITGENTIHEGYACDGCGVEPIIGVRYKCTVCDESEEIDLCSKCMALGTFANDHHTPDHPFEAIRVASALPYYADTDYAPTDTLGEYSYLGY